MEHQVANPTATTNASAIDRIFVKETNDIITRVVLPINYEWGRRPSRLVQHINEQKRLAASFASQYAAVGEHGQQAVWLLGGRGLW